LWRHEEFIVKYKHQDAIELVLSVLKDDVPLRNDFLIFNSRLNKTKRDESRGIITKEEANTELNRISLGILEQIHELDESILLSNNLNFKKNLEYNPEEFGFYTIHELDSKVEERKSIEPIIEYVPIEEKRDFSRFIDFDDFYQHVSSEIKKNRDRNRANFTDYNLFTYYPINKPDKFKEGKPIIELTPNLVLHNTAMHNYLKKSEKDDWIREHIAQGKENLLEYLESPLPTEIHTVTVILNRKKNKFLALSREKLGHNNESFPYWTAGAYRQLTSTYESKIHNLYKGNFLLDNLVESNLANIGIHARKDYGDIHISWIGLLARNLRFHVVSVVVLNIEEETFLDKFKLSADAKRKYSDCKFADINEDIISDFIFHYQENKKNQLLSNDFIFIRGQQWNSNVVLNLIYAWKVITKFYQVK